VKTSVLATGRERRKGTEQPRLSQREGGELGSSPETRGVLEFGQGWTRSGRSPSPPAAAAATPHSRPHALPVPRRLFAVGFGAQAQSSLPEAVAAAARIRAGGG